LFSVTTKTVNHTFIRFSFFVFIFVVSLVLR
jgi:hypothetical protein